MKFILFLMAGMSLLLTSCHSDYLHINYSLHHGAVVANSDSNTIAFMASKIGYLPAEGISRFPDGGTPEYLLKDVGLYVFNNQTNRLQELLNFNDLVELIGPSRSTWNSIIIFKDSIIYYQILPVSDWKFIASWNKNSNDSALISNLKEKYSKCYSIDINTQKINIVDSTSFNMLLQENNQTQKYSLTELNNILDNTPLSNWGLQIREIFPKPDEEYVDETIYLKNESKMTRRAVIEQIISGMNKPDIKSLLKKMEDHKNSLEGLERKEYEIYSKDTYESIQALL